MIKNHVQKISSPLLEPTRTRGTSLYLVAPYIPLPPYFPFIENGAVSSNIVRD